MTYKNKEGYPDPTQGDALNGVRREEKQRLLEKKHGFKRGQKIITIKMIRDEMHKEAKKKKITYTVVEYIPTASSWRTRKDEYVRHTPSSGR